MSRLAQRESVCGRVGIAGRGYLRHSGGLRASDAALINYLPGI
ncbi:MAG: hypothetical protein AB9Q18_04890 [Candidatus Reddybacter sp.]